MRWCEFQSHVRHLPTADLQRVRKAFEMGKEAHCNQKRKSGQLYFTHPIAVAHLLADMGADSDTIIAALLHDTVEDSSITIAQLNNEFDGSVPGLVDGVTKLSRDDIGENPTLEEETETLRKIFTFMQEDVRIMIIKLADRLHNMQTSEFLGKERQKSIAQETLDVYVKIADRLCMRDLRDDLEEICISILESEKHKKLSELKIKNEKIGNRIIANIINILDKSHPSLLKKIHVKYEYKSWGKLDAQLKSEGTTITGISFYTAVFIAKDIPGCYEVLGALHENWQREKMSFEDYINTPMVNGYKGLHTTIILEDGTRVRCKIRTKEMDDYSHIGITAKCFDSEATGLLEYLPWTDRIATLSADTTDRSAQFWASLQSDILGDTIAIHGTNDKVISLPIGATALDGAFYLLGKKALSVSTINVDGKETQFAIPIENAASLDFSMTNSQTFTREWLDWVHTGYATAIIRETLGQQSDYHKIRAGKKLLQDTLGEHKKGFIEEFDQEGIKNALTAIGYSSLKDTYIALADGHLDPEEVYNAIFHPKDIAKGGRATLSILRYTRTMNDGELLNRIIQAYKNYRVSFKTIHQQHKSKSNTEVITVKAMLTPEQRKSIVADLKAVGADNVSCTASLPTLAYHLGIILLIALWGLDPLFAHYILDHISAYDLTLIRFVMLFIGATLMYTFQKILSKQKLKPISPKDTSIIVSALALFLTGLTSYLSLTLIPPDQYILIIIGGITLAALIKNLFTPKAKIVHLVVSLLAVIISATLLIQTEGYVLIGLMLAIASSFGFVLYSQISSKYQKGTLHARYPAFIFWISVIILPFLLLLLPYTQILSLSAPILITSLLYVLIFAVTPYALYFECMRNVSGETLDHALPFVFVSTIIGEMILNQSLIQLITIPLIFVFLWQYMVIQKENN